MRGNGPTGGGLGSRLIVLPYDLPIALIARETPALKLTIRRKLVASIGVPLLVTTVALIWLQYHRLADAAVGQMQARVEDVSQRYAAMFDGQFATVAQIARSTASALAADNDPSAMELDAILRTNLKQHRLIYGACISFEPGEFTDKPDGYAPYAQKLDDRVIIEDLAQPDANYRKSDWYLLPQRTGAVSWTEPSFDRRKGAQPIVTCVAPIIRNGKFRGVVSLDLLISRIQDQVGKSTFRSGGFMILSRSGTYVSHPSATRIMTDTIFDTAERTGSPELAEVGRRALSGQTELRRLSGFELIHEPVWVFCTPIQATGWSFATLVVESEFTGPVFVTLQQNAITLLSGLFFVTCIMIYASTRITKPLEDLAAGVARVTAGDLRTPTAEVRSRDEIGDLSRAFNKMLVELGARIEALRVETAAREAVESEVRVARDIQKTLLPADGNPFPGRSDPDVHAVNAPAHGVAGDFYDYFLCGPDDLMLVIADVSGKGVPAALMMAVTRTLVRELAQWNAGPADILRGLNRALAESDAQTLFVTLIVGRYDASTGVLRYANGGHLPPIRVGANGVVKVLLGDSGACVGVLDEADYQAGPEHEVALAPGEAIVLYTDGLTEARRNGDANALFGEAALCDVLASSGDASATVICHQTMAAVDQFQGADRADDLTMLVLRRPRAD